MPLNHPITPALLADPEIFQQNRLPFHAHFADQTSPELPLTVSLDGEWNFRYAENLTAPFYGLGHPDRARLHPDAEPAKARPALRRAPLRQHPVPVGRPRKAAPR